MPSAPELALPELLSALVEKCEESEVSELSPVWTRHNWTILLSTSVLANVPSFIQRHVSPYPGSRRCDVFQLSKPLNQENALSAPCSWVDFSSPQARPRRAAGMLRTVVIRHFECHFTVCYTQVIMPARADAFPVGSGRCTGRAHRCKAKQGRRGETALTCGSWSYSSTVLGSRP